MIACSQCGTLAKPTDKFCNSCGTALSQGADPGRLPATPFRQPGPQVPYGPQGGGGFPAQPASPSSYDPYGPGMAPHPQNPNPQHPYPPKYGYNPPQQGQGYQASPYVPTQGVPLPAQPQMAVPQVPQAPVYDPNAHKVHFTPVSLRGFLACYETNPQGEFWPLFGGSKTIGRANSNAEVDLPFADATISSRHAVLHVDAVSGIVTVEDTQSTNGTYVNEEHIGYNGKHEVKDGDKIRFGGFSVIVKIIHRA